MKAGKKKLYLEGTKLVSRSKFCQDDRMREGLRILCIPRKAALLFYSLNTCIAVEATSKGKQIHSHVNGRELEFNPNAISQNKLINMYDKCGSLVDARRVFDNISQPDIFSWNMIVAAYRKHGFLVQALTLFHQMQRTAVQPDEFSFSTILPVCVNASSLDHGLQIHGKIIRCGFQLNGVVASALIHIYAKCGMVEKARELFDRVPTLDVVLWTAMLTGYAQNGVLDEALSLFEAMPQRDRVSWTAIIAGYAQNGLVDKGLEIFKQMKLAGVYPNSATFASILPACAKMGALKQGGELHTSIIKAGFLSDIVVVTALVDMYAKCGGIQKARRLFDKMKERNVVSWNAMIVGYSQSTHVGKAVGVFMEMQMAGVKADSATFVSILPACAETRDLERGMEIHQKIIRTGFLLHVVVVNALIDMYAKCGCMQKAQQLFDKMLTADGVSGIAVTAEYAQNDNLDKVFRVPKEIPLPNVVSWTAIISGYTQNGPIHKALENFKHMLWEGINPNSATFASILPVCAKIGDFEQGIEIHQRIMESGHVSDVIVANALMDMYAKCGNVKKARQLFDNLQQPDTSSWNIVIAAYAMHGYKKDALNLFEQMKHYGRNPDQVTLVCVLFACSHAGLVNQGCKHFNYMSSSYCIIPIMDHYVCMIDLLGRAGYVEEALNFIIKMPLKPDVVAWTCLLGACRSNNNIGLGEYVIKLLLELGTKNSGPYILLSNIYAEVGRWGEAQKVRKLMKNRGIKKTPGCSWLDASKTVHAFHVGSGLYPRTQEINAKM